MVIRNRHLPECSILTGMGPIPVKQPMILDIREAKGIRFSTILPRYLRRTPFLDNLIPVVYLKGVSTGDFMEANKKGNGNRDTRNWAHRDLIDKCYV